jgi:hypothetical protein
MLDRLLAIRKWRVGVYVAKIDIVLAGVVDYFCNIASSGHRAIIDRYSMQTQGVVFARKGVVPRILLSERVA